METEGVYRDRQKESSFDEPKLTSILEPKQSSVPGPKQGSFSESKLMQRQLSSEGDKGMMFWIAVGASQVIGIICVSLIAYLGVLSGGMGWNTAKPQTMRNLHPMLMILGLIFFYGDAVIVYRVLSFLPKWILKLIHAALHLLAIVTSSVGLAAMFENHKLTKKADLYSLHSWIGLATFAFFCLQYVGSFITFLFPGMPPTIRGKVMPFHTFFGVGIFLMAVAAAHMGLTEWMSWFAPNYTNGMRSKEADTGNSLGIFLVGFAFLIVFIATHHRYKRRPLPSEIAPTN